MTLSSLGWDDTCAQAFHPYASADLLPARVVAQDKHIWSLLGEHGEITAVCTGRLMHLATSSADLPAVGDWVAYRPRTHESVWGDIRAVLPRRTKFSRRTAGEAAHEQIVAANVDTVFLVTGLDANFNLRRIERYVAAVRSSGAEAVILLNKSDLSTDLAATLASVRTLAPDLAVIAVSAARDSDLDALAAWVRPGRTLAFIGSSGVGKSTLINRLIGAPRQSTGAISMAVNKGRHTTTRRELIPLSSGALVIDTPGMRELQLWDTPPESVDATFADVSALAARCCFHDCSHTAEPGCAIIGALDSGKLDAARWASFQKLQREAAYAARRADPRLARESRDRWKKIHQHLRARENFERDQE